MNTTEPETDRAVTRVPQLFPTLRLLFSGDAGLQDSGLALGIGTTWLGREAPNFTGTALQHDRRLTRKHARITVSPDGARARIFDEKSKNHTFVNGRKITEHTLSDGDLIRMGNSILLVRYDPAPLLDAEIKSLLGSAPATRRLRKRILEVSSLSETVLILGESGTGKEVAARALHAASGRKGTFVPVNCAAIPAELAESQFFGHVAGAFSGAHTNQRGYFQAAEGGTLLLDEIGDLPLGLQPKLLRALEERSVVRVGETKAEPYNIRLCAATNRDLQRAVQTGGFRGDLYMRLASLIIELPPLRTRREDILPLLFHNWVGKSPTLTARLAEALLLYHWPFNVRELQKVAIDLQSRSAGAAVLDLPLIADRLAIPETGLGRTEPLPQCATPLLQPPNPPAFDAEAQSSPNDSHLTRAELVRLLADNKGIVQRVADKVGRSRRQVARWMQEYSLRRKDFMR